MDDSFGMAYAKAQMAAGNALPIRGRVFLSVNDRDKGNLEAIASDLIELGFTLVATRGTASHLQRSGLDVATVLKVSEGRPNGVDAIINGEIDLVVNTPLGGRSFGDEHVLREAAIAHRIPMLTTLSAARAATQAIKALHSGHLQIKSLQEYIASPLAGNTPL